MHSNYPHLTLGYHGCDRSIRDSVIAGKAFQKSQNSYDWLGNGIYFWKNDERQAMEWAREQAKRGKIKAPSVVGAVLDLGNCLNLMERESIELLRVGYDLLKYKSDLFDIALPENQNVKKQ